MELDHISIESSEENSHAENLTDEQKYPWTNKQTLSVQNPNVRLHNEIVEFYKYIQPSQKERENWKYSSQKIVGFLQEKNPDSRIHIFGSYYNNLYLPNSDIDIVMIQEDKD